MGEWLETLRLWHAFSTWTFEHPVTVAGAMHQGREHVHLLESRVNGWDLRPPSEENAWGYVEDPQLTLPRKAVQAFVGVEEGGVGGLVHLHALVHGVDSLKADCGSHAVTLDDQVKQFWKGHQPFRCCMKHAWPRGIARVFDYDPTMGAAYYVGKYISKRLAEWELLGFPATPQKNS